MLQSKPYPVDEIYVPADKRKTLDPARVEALAGDIIENGLTTPIQIRQGKGRYVLISGLHRLEAMKALGEDMIDAFVVQARRR